MPRRTTDAALLIAMLLCLAAAPMVPLMVAVGCVAVLFVLTAVAVLRRAPAPARVGVLLCIFFVMVAYPPMRNTWPLPMLLTIGAYLGIRRFVPWLSEGSDFWRRGRIDAQVVFVSLAFVVMASVALLLWTRLAEPDLSDLHAQIPPNIPLALIVLGGVLFSILNALGEEFLWRGAILEALDRTLGRGALPVVIQAASFGLAHIMGFPRGWIGVALASVYGLMMGIVRRRSKGMLAPIVAHVFADMTIVGILVWQVIGT
jgi:uncharacterized protein